jgi:hypothetical protein
MQTVQVSDVFSQTLQSQLGGQNVTLNIYQLSTSGVDSNGNLTTVGLYMDVLINGQPIITGVICHSLNRIVRNAYLGFIGDLGWVDTQGTSSPSSPGLGTRYQLMYLSADDVAGRD